MMSAGQWTIGCADWSCQLLLLLLESSSRLVSSRPQPYQAAPQAFSRAIADDPWRPVEHSWTGDTVGPPPPVP